MKITPQELAATYQQYSDDDLAALAAETERLTADARAALEAEIQLRGISSMQLQKLHAKEIHREARFDQLETIRRKKRLLYLLTKNDPKGCLVVVLIALLLAAIVWLRSLLH